MGLILARGKVVNLSSSSTKQNICKLIADITIRRLAVNTTKLPSFFPGPNILYTKSSKAGEIFISRTTLRTCKERENTTVFIYYHINQQLFTGSENSRPKRDLQPCSPVNIRLPPLVIDHKLCVRLRAQALKPIRFCLYLSWPA